MKLRNLLKITVSGLSLAAFAGAAHAADFNVPAGDLKTALDAYTNQSGVAVIVPSDQVRGARTAGVKGDLTADAALSRILSGTGFSVFRYSTGAVGIAREDTRSNPVRPVELAQATPARAAAGVETVVVTSSKIKGDIQTVPIAITALSPGTVHLAPDRGRAGPGEGSSEPYVLQNQFLRLHHPDSRHRHTGNFGFYRSGCGGGAERYSVHPQSFLRAGILRRQSGRSRCAGRRARSMAATRPRAW